MLQLILEIKHERQYVEWKDDGTNFKQALAQVCGR